jgi:hypothetical protein
MEKNFEIDVQAASLAQAFAGLAGDLAVVLDAEGRVLAAAGGAAASAPGQASGNAREGWEDWTGRPWPEVAASDSRVKAEALLTEALREGQARRREMNLCRRASGPRAGAGQPAPGPAQENSAPASSQEPHKANGFGRSAGRREGRLTAVARRAHARSPARRPDGVSRAGGPAQRRQGRTGLRPAPRYPR